MSLKEKCILFSGRFDFVHRGHYETIMRLGQRYGKVLVVVLDYPEQTYSVQYRAQKLRETLDMAKGNYEVVVNKEHFGKITFEQSMKYSFDVYGSGNMDCLKHMESLGYAVEYVPRTDDISATDERVFNKIKDIMKEAM